MCGWGRLLNLVLDIALSEGSREASGSLWRNVWSIVSTTHKLTWSDDNWSTQTETVVGTLCTFRPRCAHTAEACSLKEATTSSSPDSHIKQSAFWDRNLLSRQARFLQRTRERRLLVRKVSDMRPVETAQSVKVPKLDHGRFVDVYWGTSAAVEPST